MKAEIVVLPTDKESYLIKGLYDDKIYIVKNFNLTHTDFIPQHLYVVSNEGVKPGDWLLLDYRKIVKVEEFHGSLGFHSGPAFLFLTEDKRVARKIIATTDLSLILETLTTSVDSIGKTITHKSIHRIPEEFVNFYVGQYNEKNMILDVVLEEKDVLSKERFFDGKWDFKPKVLGKTITVNSDNTVNIKAYNVIDEVKFMVEELKAQSFEGWSEKAINDYMGSIRRIDNLLKHIGNNPK